MNVQLTEKQIRERASDQSFRKGQDYYDTGAIYNPARQSIPGGVTLTAQCEGTSAPSYRLQVELDGGGVRSTSCTCPYDWGGDCKHIVALLLMYIHEPDEFSEQKSVNELLAGLEKDALVALILRLVERDPGSENFCKAPVFRYSEETPNPGFGRNLSQTNQPDFETSL